MTQTRQYYINRSHVHQDSESGKQRLISLHLNCLPDTLRHVIISYASVTFENTFDFKKYRIKSSEISYEANFTVCRRGILDMNMIVICLYIHI